MSRITPQEAAERITAQQPQVKSGAARMIKAKRTPVEFVRTIDYGLSDEGEIYLMRQGEQAILTHADGDLPPILGEWDDKDITAHADGDLPPNLQDWLGEYAREIAYHLNVPTAQADDIFPDDLPQSEENRKDIPALITNTWGQGSPWNKHLTMDGNKMIVGCGALSAAQVIFYWGCQAAMKFHRGCTATDAYTSPKMGVKVGAMPPITVFDYANMVGGVPKTEAQIEAVATLCEYVSKAFQSDYGTSLTTTYPNICTEKLRTKLRMGSGIKSIFSASGAAAWEKQVYNEIANGRPVLMSGWNPTTGGGHAFVCDGYRLKDDKYHFNWGWSGSYNGWFAMSALTPYNRNYNANKRCIIGIQPDYKLGDVNGDGTVNVTDAMTIISAANKGETSDRTDINSDGKTNVTDAMIVVNNILGKEKL